ncbi:MAG: hypothetical protein ACE366_03080 [Bradymonadia bacterium]
MKRINPRSLLALITLAGVAFAGPALAQRGDDGSRRGADRRARVEAPVNVYVDVGPQRAARQAKPTHARRNRVKAIKARRLAKRLYLQQELRDSQLRQQRLKRRLRYVHPAKKRAARQALRKERRRSRELQEALARLATPRHPYVYRPV